MWLNKLYVSTYQKCVSSVMYRLKDVVDVWQYTWNLSHFSYQLNQTHVLEFPVFCESFYKLTPACWG